MPNDDIEQLAASIPPGDETAPIDAKIAPAMIARTWVRAWTSSPSKEPSGGEVDLDMAIVTGDLGAQQWFDSIVAVLDNLNDDEAVGGLPDDEVGRLYAVLAAGPMEDLLKRHGAEVIDQVESLAHSRPDFAFLLGGVWQSSIPDHLWERVRAVTAEVW